MTFYKRFLKCLKNFAQDISCLDSGQRALEKCAPYPTEVKQHDVYIRECNQGYIVVCPEFQLSAVGTTAEEAKKSLLEKIQHKCGGWCWTEKEGSK